MEKFIKTVAYDSLKAKNVAMIDSSSIVNCFLQPAVRAILTEPSEHFMSEYRFNDLVQLLYSANSLQKLDAEMVLWNKKGYVRLTSIAIAFEILERLFLYDNLIIDEYGLESRGVSRDDPALAIYQSQLRTVRIPDQVYINVTDKLRLYESEFKKHGVDFAFCGDVITDEVSYFQLLFDRDLVSSTIRGSHEGFARAFFYLELSRMLYCPLLLSPMKRKWLLGYPMQLQENIFKSIESTFEKELINNVRQSLKNNFNIHTQIQAPPLIRILANHAREHNLSLLESAIVVSQKPDAIAFRQLLYELQACLMKGGRYFAMVERKLNDLQKISVRWRTDGMDCLTEKIERTLELGAVPMLGWVFKALGFGKVVTRLPALKRPPRYLTFLAKWYRD